MGKKIEDSRRKEEELFTLYIVNHCRPVAAALMNECSMGMIVFN